MQNTENNWQTLSTKICYDNPWIRLTEHDVINPSGNQGIYGKVHFKNVAVGIIPIDEKRNIHLVGQYRYTLGKYSIEIPEGGALHPDIPLDAAKRELEEETGILAKNWKHILTMHLSNSVTDEIAMVYLATDLTFSQPKPEETEKIDQLCIHLDEAFKMVLNHEITDSMSVAGILFVKSVESSISLK